MKSQRKKNAENLVIGLDSSTTGTKAIAFTSDIDPQRITAIAISSQRETFVPFTIHHSLFTIESHCNCAPYNAVPLIILSS